MGLLVFGAMRSRGQNTGMMPKRFQQMGGRDDGNYFQDVDREDLINIDIFGALIHHIALRN
jgi:hypothetical protein